MRKFDTKVQDLKYRVLREVAKEAWADRLHETAIDVPKKIVPGKVPTMRCCVYKERAILAERVKLAMGREKNNERIIEVIDIACDECPIGGYEVTNSCRGCLAHHCERVCKFGAISFNHNRVAIIDKSKCKECGACAKVCPYTAIRNYKRPCELACKIKAIKMGEEKEACIDDSKCISCGACVYQCPFGAISDRSFILDAIDILKNSENNEKYKTYAVVAPSIASQFDYAKLGQVVTGLKKLGFHAVVEAALGADVVTFNEAKELSEKGFLMSSCCPAFVDFIEKNYPDLKQHVSGNLSPLATICKHLKEDDSTCKTIFIGPCTAKKAEIRKEEVKPFVDVVLTFEELQALFDSRDIELTELEESVLDDASTFGRLFARSGGLSIAIKQGLTEQGVENFELKPHACNGIEACKLALLMKSKGKLDANFVEGMACLGGCIGGAGCLTHGEKDKSEVDLYANEADNKTITSAISKLNK